MAEFLDELRFEIRGEEVLVLLGPLRYRSADAVVYEAPVGMETDLASVPRWLRWLTPHWTVSARPGVLHDYLYGRDARPPTGRRRADDLFREALRVEGASWGEAFSMWLAVRVAGGPAYEPRAG